MRALLLLSLLVPQLAAAKCMAPSAFVVAPDTAPPDPTVWVFVPGGWREVSLTVTVDGAPTAAAATLTSYGDGQHGFPATVHAAEAGPIALTTPDLSDANGRIVPHFAVWAVAIDADAGQVTVALNDGYDREGASFAIDPAWKAPRAAAVTLTDLGVEQMSWTCSHQHTRNLRPSVDAPVYRLEWAVTEQAWRDGERHTLLLPRAMDPYFGRDADTMLELGHVNCNGYTMTRGGAIWAAAVGLYADGSETPLPDPVRVVVPGR